MYSKSTEQQALDTLLKKYPHRPLHEIASFHKARRLEPSQQPANVFQVNPNDFPRYGYVTQGKDIQLGHGSQKTPPSKLFLKGHDIIIATGRGGFGRVAIMPPELPPPGENGWVTSQICTVLRINDPKTLDSRVLYSFLKSELGIDQILQCFQGAQDWISLPLLNQIAIPLPTASEQTEIIQKFSQITVIDDQIDQLRTQQAAIAASIWA